MACTLRDGHVAGNDGFQGFVGEVFAQLLSHFVAQLQLLVEHRQEQALDG